MGPDGGGGSGRACGGVATINWKLSCGGCVRGELASGVRELTSVAGSLEM